MVKTLVTSQQDLRRGGAQMPVADEELEPEAMAEIIRRAEQMRQGEDTVFSNEEVLSEFASEVERLLELVDESS